jgi:hypothetical protein
MKRCSRVRLWNLELEKRNLRSGDDLFAGDGREMNSSSVDTQQNVNVERGASEGVAIQE